jgi:hypothetical protein
MCAFGQKNLLILPFLVVFPNPVVSNKGIMTSAFAIDQANGLDGHLIRL